MSGNTEIQNMALFCDFENVALGVQEVGYPSFDIRKVLQRLLLKGDIVVKKAYCDWERYKEFKKPMHEAAFELIEIPHVRQSGKNSADIRMVVDALDLCYTKAHVDCFVIISGDSDFSPLVSKLRENNKTVIGVGVRKSTSDLLTANCDEFIFYDDLIREEQKKEQKRREQLAQKEQLRKDAQIKEQQKAAQKSQAAAQATAKKPSSAPAKVVPDPASDPQQEAKRLEGIQLVVETVEAMAAERGDEDKLHAGAIKSALKRQRPEFSESVYGYSTFGKLLEAAHKRGLLSVDRDEKTKNYLVRLPHREE